ncbi:MAG: caspase family protein [Candidatus Korarchaeota archaeon]|nr:caspase family protein [Thermoproteota archaeon]
MKAKAIAILGFLLVAALTAISVSAVYAKSYNKTLPDFSDLLESRDVAAIIYEFVGSLSAGKETPQYSFSVDSTVTKIEVTLNMPSGTDFDLSVWDPQGRRTGGWTSTDKSVKTQIPNSKYSGDSANPEWVTVSPPASTGTWKTSCYAYSGSGNFKITVKLYVTSTSQYKYIFSGSVSSGKDSTQHSFSVPSTATKVEVTLNMPSGTDFDLSVWDAQNRRTGGWTSTDKSVKNQIPNAQYSGYSTNPEKITVSPIDSTSVGTWKTSCYAYSGSGTYTITVVVTLSTSNGGGSSGGSNGGSSGSGDGVVRKWAVIVGISDYKAISDLSYCDEDATDWYNFLTGKLGWPSSNIKVYGDGSSSSYYPKYDGKATEYNVKQALNWLVTTADADDIIAFISSGHGSGDGKGNSYLCMWDSGAGENGEDGNLWDYELAAILKNAIAAKIFVFLDHCYSGGFGNDLMSMPNSARVYLTTTCTEKGYGYDDPNHKNGAWTYYFLEYSWIGKYGGSPDVALEDVYAYAKSAYPYGGNDAPQQFDGNPNSPFYLK